MTDLPKHLRDNLAGRKLIIFDGECVLCSSFYRFVLRWDRDHVFCFATAQSEVGQAFYAALNLSTTDFDTNLVVMDSVVFTHLDSFAAVMGNLPWPWKGLRLVRLLPRWLKNPAYRLIARKRFALLGKNDSCLMPDTQTEERFVQGGW